MDIKFGRKEPKDRNYEHYNSVNVVEQGNTTSTGLSVTTCNLKASVFC